MLLLEYPLTCLYIALGLLVFFLLLFKIINKLEETKAKEKKPKETKKEEVVEKKEDSVKTLEDLPGDDKNNYLYDRFVTNPTKDDDIQIKTISDTFITEKDLEKIRTSKTHIRVSPVQKISCGCHVPSETSKKIEYMVNENKSARNKLLKEFDGLSKEMKLLLIENILNKMD